MFQINSPFFRFISTIGNIILASILWIIGCIPIITIGTSSAALYYTCVKVICRDRGYLLTDFFHAYKANLKQGCIVTMVSLFISFLLYTNNRYISSLASAPYYLIVIYRITFTLFVVTLIYIIPNMSRFTMKLFELLKLSIFMVIRHFYQTFIMFVLCVAFFILILSIPVLLFFLPATYMLLQSLIMENVLKKYMRDITTSSDSDVWYLE